MKGFAELYKVKPDFPIEFLGRWLRNYSKGQARHAELEDTKHEKENKIAAFEMQKAELITNKEQERLEKEAKLKRQEGDFEEKVEATRFLVDLLDDYLPRSIEAQCADRHQSVTGCYVG